MRILRVLAVVYVLGSPVIPGARCWAAQNGAAARIEFTVQVRPSAGQAEAVRGMTFYLLSKSLSDIRKEVEKTAGRVDLDHFIAQLDFSAELKEWMNKHRRVDLAGDDFIKELTADDIVGVPEFLAAYAEQNGAALHAVIPEPRFKAGDEQKNPEKYKLRREQYRQALRRYIQSNLDSLQGLDAELRDLNPSPRWIHLQSEQQRHIQQRALQLAQTHDLVATAVTNLKGGAAFEDLAPGEYWISNLDTPALTGDLRLFWDVGLTLAAGKTVRMELSNLNALESSENSR